MQPTRRRSSVGVWFSGGLAALTTALTLTACTGAGDDADTPVRNLVFISIDTLRADHLGVYGYQRPTSPEIDRLAERSVVFRNCFTTMPKTGPANYRAFQPK